jgi:hypothetical protein
MAIAVGDRAHDAAAARAGFFYKPGATPNAKLTGAPARS